MNTVQTFLIFPKDKTALLDAQPEVARIAHAAAERIRDWLAAETGYIYELIFHHVISNKTARELGSYVPDSPFPNIPHDDPCGQGLDWGTAMAELKQLTGIVGDPPVGRVFGLFINGGGWAGGMQTWHPDKDRWLDDYSKGTTVGTNIGLVVFGDWLFQYAATGVPDPCAIREHGEAFARDDFTKAWGHEMLHGFGVECHTPVTYYPDHLNAEQKAAFIEHNEAFLRPVLPPIEDSDEPVEPVVPVPPAPVTRKIEIVGDFTVTDVEP